MFLLSRSSCIQSTSPAYSEIWGMAPGRKGWHWHSKPTVVSEGYFPWERQADITPQHGDHQRTGVCEVMVSAALKQFMGVPYTQATEAVSSGTFSDALGTPRSTAPQSSAVLCSLRGTKPGLSGVSTPGSTALLCSALLCLQRARAVWSCKVLQVVRPRPLSLETLRVWPWKTCITLLLCRFPSCQGGLRPRFSLCEWYSPRLQRTSI